jgi:iron complex transport system substrate-binding protein
MKSKNKIRVVGLFLCVLIIGFADRGFASPVRTIVDMGGRTVQVPQLANHVFSSSPIGTIMMYSLNSDKIAGLNWSPTVAERNYLKAEYLELPVLSGWFGSGNVGNTEEIIKTMPDLILIHFYGKANAGTIDQANRIQMQLNVPVVLIDASLENLGETYALLGKLVGEQERAEQLARYVVELEADIKRRAAAIPTDQKISVYYAEGADGLQTDPSGSRHARVIDWVGAINVAQVKISPGIGRTAISAEQLLQWNPDVILAYHDRSIGEEGGTYQALYNEDYTAQLKAIKTGQVYEVPYKPFNFIDRPPSINRLIGLKWLGHLLYPEIFNYDVRAETVEFYRLFYNINLSKEQLNDIFKHAE